MSQLAFALAERGAALAADRANRMHEAWTGRALEAFRAYAATHDVFTTEDVIAAAHEVPAAPEKRAWGHVALTAKRRGIISKAGFATAKAVHAHCRPVSLWHSLIFSPVLVAA